MADFPDDQPVICTVSVRREKSQDEGTCSGILIDSKNGVVLTHASVLASQLPKKSAVIKDLDNKVVWSQRHELSTLDVQVLFPPLAVKMALNYESKNQIHPALLNSNEAEHLTGDEFSGSIYGVLKVQKLSSILQKLMPGENWEFVEDLKTPDFDKKHVNKIKKDEEHFYKLLPCFALIKIKNWVPFESFFTIRSAEENTIGDNVEIVGTPFGGLNPDIFLNSCSKGIISNVAGKNKVLILTDTRCVPGSEGGALYYCHGNKRLVLVVLVQRVAEGT